MGRPCEYTQQTADLICAKLAEGISLRSVCLEESMPCTSTIFTWMRRFPEFLQQYARAKEEAADAMIEEMLDIADDGSNDWMEWHKGDNSGWMINGEATTRSKLRVDTRKWIASKLKPKKYGDSTALTGPGGGPLQVMQWPIPKTSLDQP